MARIEPDSRDRYRHFVAMTTRLMDNDLYNHLNNATYYSFIDTAVTSYLTQAVRRDLERIFDYRHDAIERRFGSYG